MLSLTVLTLTYVKSAFETMCVVVNYVDSVFDQISSLFRVEICLLVCLQFAWLFGCWFAA